MIADALVLDTPQGAPSSSTSTFTHRERVRYLMNYGVHAMAFSTMQPDLEYFDIPGIGYLAYARYLGMTFALSDPICNAQHVETMLDRFVERFPNAMFAQVTKNIADIMHRRHGYYGTQFGSESKVPLSNWDLRGRKKQIIRTAVNQAKEQGVEIREGPFDEQANAISESWIKTRKCKNNEIRFLVRPMVMDYEEGTRYFYAHQNGSAVGFIFFDPIYRGGKVVAYVPNISRSCASFKQGLWYAMMVHAMDVFKAEDIEYVDLGLTPLMLADELEDQESRPLRLIQKQIYRWGNSLYNFKGLEFAKSRFQGQVVKSYVCHRNRLPGAAILAMFRLTRLI
jgi:lysylphosphatidylglycerol synthetase-like protein (DUF2156 family)